MLTYTEPSRREATPIPRSPNFTPGTSASDVLDLVNLTPLMELTSGRPEIVIGLVDGPVVIDHPDLTGENVREMPGRIGGTCARASSLACMHGTFIAGILSAKRNSPAPGICPGCPLLVRSIFSETPAANELIPSATPEELATAIIDCIDAGARLVNLSAALERVLSARGERALGQALDYAASRDVIVVAAAGNQGTGSTAITRHRSVIAVIGCDGCGRPLSESNLGNSIGRRGLSAPGEGITSLGTVGDAAPSGGTSVAAPFVTGAIALVWSEFPSASAGQIRVAITQAHTQCPPTVIPPLLNAGAIYAAMREFRSMQLMR
jgi:subtilisin family serine protease